MKPEVDPLQMAAVVPSIEERIASLKSQLREAEREAALDKTVAIMQADQPKPALGPIVMAPVSVERMLGSPCT